MGTATSNRATSRKVDSKRIHGKEHHPNMNRVAAIILGGGEGSRLFPLTQSRCKPAISFGGRYKLIDVPISNSINSGCHKIFVITQFLSASLHQHIFKTYRNEHFSSGFLELLSAEQKPGKAGWYKGTADAVRQNLEYLLELPVDYFPVLSGHQLYTMDYQELVWTAKETNADLVIAALPIKEKECSRMGILQIDEEGKIIDFAEKPTEPAILKEFEISSDLKEELDCTNIDCNHLGSMGIYLFKREALFKLLLEDLRDDFGKHLLPTMISKGNAAAYLFEGYWEDIGTIESFYQANIALTAAEPPFDCYSESSPLYTMHYNLAGPKIFNALINQSIICEGSIVEADEIRNSILGPRTVVKRGSVITDSYIMGNDYYHSPVEMERKNSKLSIGKNCFLRKVIVDKNAHIGDNVRLINRQGITHHDGGNFFVRDGIIIVPRGSVIADGFIF